MTQSSLPIIDLDLLNQPGAPREHVIAQLLQAAHQVGFFYIINHGVDQTLSDSVQDLSREFFSLPAADKQSVAMIHSPHFRGYSAAGSELTRQQPDWREQFDIGAHRNAYVVNQPAWRRLQGPNQWPQALPQLRPTLELWQGQMTALGQRLLAALAEALQLPDGVFDAFSGDDAHQHIKLIHYPGQQPELGTQGVGAHKDSGFLSFLLQDNQAGLQVSLANQQWIDVPPVAGSFVVNIGELLELATQGFLTATLHRVVSPQPPQSRLSIAFFFGAKLDAYIPVLPLPAIYQQGGTDLHADADNPLLREVGWNYLKGRLRSHPDVAERYYADVLSKAVVLNEQ